MSSRCASCGAYNPDPHTHQCFVEYNKAKVVVDILLAIQKQNALLERILERLNEDAKDTQGRT